MKWRTYVTPVSLICHWPLAHVCKGMYGLYNSGGYFFTNKCTMLVISLETFNLIIEFKLNLSRKKHWILIYRIKPKPIRKWLHPSKKFFPKSNLNCPALALRLLSSEQAWSEWLALSVLWPRYWISGWCITIVTDHLCLETLGHCQRSMSDWCCGRQAERRADGFTARHNFSPWY